MAKKTAVKKKTVRKNEPRVKQQYDSADTKERLIRAALEVFSRDGYDAATTKKIAASAGVNESLIQRYFQGKLGLLFKLMEDFHHRYRNIELEAPAPTIESEVKNFFALRLKFGKEAQAYHKLISVRAIVDPAVRKEILEYSKSQSSDLELRMKAFQSSGKMRKDIEVSTFCRSLESIVMGWLFFTDVMEVATPERFKPIVEMTARLLAESVSVRN